jgi:hypothetical protein
MKVPFDENSGEKYQIEVFPADIDSGDGIVLTLNKKACAAFSELFSQLASASEDTHLHLGYDESEPQGPGFRVVLRNDT